MDTENVMSIVERLYKVSFITPNGCWSSRLGVCTSGYSQVWDKNQQRLRMAHVVSWEHFVGPLQPGLEIDRLCFNTVCWNPFHLEPVTHSENVRRSRIFNRTKTHCPKGHEYSPENTRFANNTVEPISFGASVELAGKNVNL